MYCIRKTTPNQKPHEQGDLVAKFLDYETAKNACNELHKAGECGVYVCEYREDKIEKSAGVQPFNTCFI